VKAKRGNAGSGDGTAPTMLKRVSGFSELGILAGFLLMVAVFSVLSPYFLTVNNLLSIVRQSSINAVIALGLTIVIISGGIDLSVGSIVALVAVMSATWMK
jgi:ribose transport system permease protein